jgi:predicted hotdog family 3-hydroxylacyl-ACP dehydratase
MRWIREAAFSEGVATARLAIGTDHPFVRGGVLLPSALVEVMAQAAAAGSALQSPGQQRRVKQGYLVAMRAFTVTAPVAAGASLEVTARHERSFGHLSQATLEVRHGGMVIASARMTFHLEFE